MANNTEEYWEVDGVSLHQFGWSVSTLGGGRYALPPRRGSDLTVAYRPGQVHRPKMADSRTITLLMWLSGGDPATGDPTSDAQLQWSNSWNFMRRLFWRPNGAQVTLTRRWRLTDPVTSTVSVVVCSAKAQLAGTMEPSMQGRAHSTFSVDLLLADPFFYGDEVETTIPLDTPTVITNPGDDAAAYYGVSLDFVDALVNPKLTNSTPEPNVWVKLTRSLVTLAQLDVDNFAVAPSVLSLGLITHSGARSWMGLLPGDNTLTLTADSGSGHAVLRFKPPYV